MPTNNFCVARIGWEIPFLQGWSTYTVCPSSLPFVHHHLFQPRLIILLICFLNSTFAEWPDQVNLHHMMSFWVAGMGSHNSTSGPAGTSYLPNPPPPCSFPSGQAQMHMSCTTHRGRTQTKMLKGMLINMAENILATSWSTRWVSTRSFPSHWGPCSMKQFQSTLQHSKTFTQRWMRQCLWSARWRWCCWILQRSLGGQASEKQGMTQTSLKWCLSQVRQKP